MYTGVLNSQLVDQVLPLLLGHLAHRALMSMWGVGFVLHRAHRAVRDLILEG